MRIYHHLDHVPKDLCYMPSSLLLLATHLHFLSFLRVKYLSCLIQRVAVRIKCFFTSIECYKDLTYCHINAPTIPMTLNSSFYYEVTGLTSSLICSPLISADGTSPGPAALLWDVAQVHSFCSPPFFCTAAAQAFIYYSSLLAMMSSFRHFPHHPPQRMPLAQNNLRFNFHNILFYFLNWCGPHCIQENMQALLADFQSLHNLTFLSSRNYLLLTQNHNSLLLNVNVTSPLKTESSLKTYILKNMS